MDFTFTGSSGSTAGLDTHQVVLDAASLGSKSKSVFLGILTFKYLIQPLECGQTIQGDNSWYFADTGQTKYNSNQINPKHIYSGVLSGCAA